jgi:hypothetical protein
MTFAHAGHWLVGLLQFVPVLGFIAWLVVSYLRDRRRRRAGEPGQAAAE